MAEQGKQSSGQASGIISADQASRLMMLTTERIRQLVKAGYIPKSKPGQYSLVAAVQGYIRFLKDEERNSTKVASTTRKDDARTREIELRIAEREHRLIDIEEHDAIVDELCAMTRTATAGFAARITRDPVMRRKIDAEVNALLADLAARAASRGAELRAGGAVAPATGEGDA